MFRSPTYLQLGATLFSLMLFAAVVIEKRFRSARAASPASARSRWSIAGILVQGAAFWVIAAGRLSPSADEFAPASLALSTIVLCLGAAAAILFRRSAIALGDNWSLVARTRAEHRLVTEGPFARIRHPIYVAMLLLLLAFAVGLGHLVALAVALPLFLVGTAIRVREEEKLLVRQFGDVYRAYARDTPAFIPHLI